MAELRSFIFLSRLQPQTMCYLGTWIRGSLPRSHVAAQVIEVAPGLDIEPLTDVAVKHADVKAGILVVERQFGYLEIHGGTDEVQAAASAVLGALGATARDASRPEILASKIITMLDPQQAFLVNRNKIGSMPPAGCTCPAPRPTCGRPPRRPKTRFGTSHERAGRTPRAGARGHPGCAAKR